MPTLNPQSSVRHPRRRPARRHARNRAALAAISLFVAIAVPATAAGATPTKTPVDINVSSAATWTHTGIQVTIGETITISASGDIHFGPRPIDHMTPAGRPPAACANQRDGNPVRFPTPTLNCWSLIGRIGAHPPFQVVSRTTFSATASGELQLGINDNRLEDNSGSWASTTTVAAASTPGGTSGGGNSSSNTILFVIIGLVVLLVLGALFFALARRRRGDEGEAIAAAPVIAPDDDVILDLHPAAAAAAAVTLDEPIVQPAPESVGSFAKAPGPMGTSVAPVVGEVADTNIFEVEIANGTDLRIGYNYFPEETSLHWQVRQGTLFAHGQFPTNGGGNMYHYVTLPLGVNLAPGPSSVDVQFTWAISGVPFRYSVRRDPGI